VDRFCHINVARSWLLPRADQCLYTWGNTVSSTDRETTPGWWRDLQRQTYKRLKDDGLSVTFQTHYCRLVLALTHHRPRDTGNVIINTTTWYRCNYHNRYDVIQVLHIKVIYAVVHLSGGSAVQQVWVDINFNVRIKQEAPPRDHIISDTLHGRFSKWIIFSWTIQNATFILKSTVTLKRHSRSSYHLTDHIWLPINIQHKI